MIHRDIHLVSCWAVQDESQAAEEPKLRHREAFPTAVTAAAYLPDGNIVIALRSTNYLRLFDPKQLKVGLWKHSLCIGSKLHSQPAADILWAISISSVNILYL